MSRRWQAVVTLCAVVFVAALTYSIVVLTDTRGDQGRTDRDFRAEVIAQNKQNKKLTLDNRLAICAFGRLVAVNPSLREQPEFQIVQERLVLINCRLLLKRAMGKASESDRPSKNKGSTVPNAPDLPPSVQQPHKRPPQSPPQQPQVPSGPPNRPNPPNRPPLPPQAQPDPPNRPNLPSNASASSSPLCELTRPTLILPC